MVTRRAVVGMMMAGALSAAAGTGEGQERHEASPDTFWPPVTPAMRPWTRWWWHGDAVDKENVTRLLEIYRQAGLGGVEITSIYGVKGQEAREILYLSPAWIEMLRHTCAEAKRLGMEVDLPPGAGWRLGGPTVPSDLASANVVVETHAVAGETAFEQVFHASPQAVVAYGTGQMPIPLTEKIDAQGRLTWNPPPGDWTVYIVSQRAFGSKVKRPSHGGEGNAINAFSERALDAALHPFNAALAALPPGAIRAQFHDSYEYEGNWTLEVFPEFLARYGYDLREHLPALVGQGDPLEGAAVRNDYRHLMGELFLERVIRPWAAQARKLGQLARNQAHGSPGNLLDLYAAADIPETEVFGADRSPRMAMFASSAAHVMGKNLVSSETCTWLAEHFTETLAEMKAEADMLFRSGINHILYHGTAYSPADATWPGWVFYASTEMNPQNPVWRDVPALNAYITRCQSVLQSGRPDNDLLLYWPERDVWQGEATPLIRQLTVHKREWFEKEPFGHLAEFLLQQGYAPDYISDKQIALAQVEAHGVLRLPGGGYRALLVPSCRLMPLETLGKLKELAEAGATVLFQHDFPEDVPGWGDLGRRRARLKALCTEMQPAAHRIPHVADSNLRGFRVGKGAVWIGNDPLQLLERTDVRQERIGEIPGLVFARRTEEAGSLYFVANQGGSKTDGWVPFASLSARVLLMDPMTGRTGLAATRRHRQNGMEVYLQLAPGESCLLRSLATHPPAVSSWRYVRPVGALRELTGRWKVEFIAGGPEMPPAFHTTGLASWAKLGGETAERFAGTARYMLPFDLPEAPALAWLDLGAVCQSARVRVNGADLGTVLTAPYRVLVEHLKPAGNVLEIEVTGVAANRIRDLDRRGVNWKIFKDINFVNIDYKPFNAAEWPLTDCGLLGPVTLQPLEPKRPSE